MNTRSEGIDRHATGVIRGKKSFLGLFFGPWIKNFQHAFDVSDLLSKDFLIMISLQKLKKSLVLKYSFSHENWMAR